MASIQKIGPIIGLSIFYEIYVVIVLAAGMGRIPTVEMVMVGTLVFTLLLSLTNFFHLPYEEINHRFKHGIHFLSLSLELICLFVLVFLIADKNIDLQEWKIGIYITLQIVVTFATIMVFQMDVIRYRKFDNTSLLRAEYGYGHTF